MATGFAVPALGQEASPTGGEWTFVMDGDAQPQRVRFTSERDSLRGRVYGQAFAGAMTGDRLEFRAGDYRWSARVQGDTMRGWIHVSGDSSRWEGIRFRSPAAPRVFRLQPREFHRSLSAEPVPALRIYAADTVHTSTLDAGGWGPGAFGDRANKLSMGGNPLTGPFYVEGALPGDVIAVRLLRVRLNRGWGFSGTELVNNAVEPAYAAGRRAAQQDNQWRLDTLAMSAQLATPPAALANWRVPLRPFVGTIGTAASPDWAPSSRDAGGHGGNLEYARLTEGTTVLLPVRVMGAYLYLGDGHAAQGDGEVTGDALETSLDVSFTVEVRRWAFANGVRAVDAEGLMSLGVGGSLDEAMRRATSDMARWLEAEHGMSATEAALVMGMGLRFDIPDIVPPAYGVVARLPRAALPPREAPASGGPNR